MQQSTESGSLLTMLTWVKSTSTHRASGRFHMQQFQQSLPFQDQTVQPQLNHRLDQHLVHVALSYKTEGCKKKKKIQTQTKSNSLEKSVLVTTAKILCSYLGVIKQDKRVDTCKDNVFSYLCPKSTQTHQQNLGCP